MVVVSIASLKVTVREVFGATDEAESAGVVEETVGAVVSGVFEVVKPVECVIDLLMLEFGQVQQKMQ